MLCDRRRAAAILLAASVAVCLNVSAGEYKPDFTADGYLRHVKFLSHDRMGGRRPGTPGSIEAGDYLAEHFKKLGIEPGGVDGTYFQPFTVPDGKAFDPAAAGFEVSVSAGTFEVSKDWIPLPWSALGEIDGPLAFAGYGIEAPDHKYNDYGDTAFDPSGKVLLVLRYEPRDAADPKAAFGGEDASVHSLFSRKARIAAAKGAKALLIVNPPNRDPAADELTPWDAREARTSYELPMVHVSRAAAERLLAATGAPKLAELQTELDEKRLPLSRTLGDARVSIKTGLENKVLNARNVIGRLRGATAPDEYIVVGAHFDHVGTIRRGFGPGATREREPEIHNGADDNASGTSGMLETARAVAAGPRPARSILFMGFDAEEMGLLGSAHFVSEPTVPLESIKAMVNFDMIGRVGQKKLAIEGVPTAVEFPDLVKKHADPTGIPYDAPDVSDSVFGASDHASFYRKDIPVLFPFTGFHRQYHQPEDDWELIDAAGAANLLGMWYGITVELANMSSGPTFQKKPPPAPESQPATGPAVAAASAPAGGDTARPNMPRVRLGVVPSYSDKGPGLLLDAVSDGGAAKQAGMRDGDRIIQIGEFKISSVETYMGALAEFDPGQEVDIIYERDGKQATVRVKLAAPRQRRERQ